MYFDRHLFALLLSLPVSSVCRMYVFSCFLFFACWLTCLSLCPVTVLFVRFGFVCFYKIVFRSPMTIHTSNTYMNAHASMCACFICLAVSAYLSTFVTYMVAYDGVRRCLYLVHTYRHTTQWARWYLFVHAYVDTRFLHMKMYVFSMSAFFLVCIN